MTYQMIIEADAKLAYMLHWPHIGEYNCNMSPKLQQVLDDAMTLPDGDRANLAARLIDSLDNTFDEDAEAAWDAEIAKRVAELDAGKVKTVPWPELRKRL